VGGGTPTKTIASYWEGDIPWVTPKDMKVDVIEDAIDHISEQGLEASTAKLIPPGSLLMVVRGMILAHSFPTAVTAKSVTINQDMTALVPFFPEMLSCLALMAKGISRGVLGFVKRSTHGTCKLLTDELFEYPVAIPPLAEQQRIVAKVDELMALCDRLEAAQADREARRDRLVAASLARVSQPDAADAASDARAAGFHLDHFARLTTRPEHVKHLRQSILNLAVRGRLVPQDPADASPPERLSATTESPADQTTTGRQTRYLETESDRYPIPTSWLWSRLGLVGDWGSGTTPSRGKSEYFGGDISWFKSGELNDNPCLRGSEEKVSRLALEDCSFRDNQPGDVLFAMYGATIGKVAILAEPAVTNQAVVACTPCEYLFNRYLFLFLLSQRQRFHEASEGGAQPNVSKAKVVRCPIPLPPLAEQRRIVAKVDELMALCDQLEASLAAAATDRARLLESLLHEALAPAA